MNYNLPEGWCLCSQRVITADWRASVRDKWPFVGRTRRLSRSTSNPINARIQAFYNGVKPTSTCCPFRQAQTLFTTTQITHWPQCAIGRKYPTSLDEG